MLADEYELLLEKYYTAIYNYCRIKLKNDSSAADCVQEVFFILYKKLNKVEFTQNTAVWLYRAADKVVSRYLKKQRGGLSIDEAELPADEPIYDSGGGALGELLSPDELSLLNEYYVNGTPVRDIARKYGISEAGVYKRIERLKARITKHREELL